MAKSKHVKVLIPMKFNPNKARVWLLAVRPKTLVAAVVPVCMGAALAKSDGYFVGVTFSVILLTALLIQIGTNLVNDVVDFLSGADSTNRLGPTRVTQAGLLQPREVKLAAALSLGLAFIFGCYLVSIGGLPILIIGMLSLLFAVTYTAGPYPLAYHGLGDIFVLLFFGPVAVGGTYYLLSGTISSWVIIAGVAPGCISTALLAINNLRDRETDAQSSKKTLAVRLGEKFTRIQYATLLLTAGFIPLLLVLGSNRYAYSAIATLYLFFARKPMIQVLYGLSGTELNRILGTTAFQLILFGLLFCMGTLLTTG